MKGLYRGFCRNENGAETIVLNGEKIKGDWIYGGLYVNSRIYDIKADHFIITTIDGFGMIEPPMAKPIEVISETVCEAVRGLTDRNGKPIFENDIIERISWREKERAIVKYGEGYYDGGIYPFVGWYYQYPNDDDIDGQALYQRLFEENFDRFEVIGTIFDEQFAEQ